MKNLILFKKFNRAFSLVEVVVSMALILVISFSAISACIAFSTVINNSKYVTNIIAYSQASVNCINNSINQYDFLTSFENNVKFCFGKKVALSKNDQAFYDTAVQTTKIAYKLIFDCGYVDVLFMQAENNIQAQIKGYTLRSNNEVYNYSRSYNFA